MGRGDATVPLTRFQRELLAELAKARSSERYLAGGAALHFRPNSIRYSNDLDFFHDAEERVASTFAADRERLERAGYSVAVELSQPGHIHALISRRGESTRVDWAHDTAWRFMPLVRDDELGGLLLHSVDLAVNKVLALAGRDEPRDFVDILFVHETILPLGAMCWAAVGKDRGFTPHSLLELLKRRGRYRDEDFSRLDLAEPIDLVWAKNTWMAALDEAERFIRSMPPDEAGCLYWSEEAQGFVMPSAADRSSSRAVPHFGSPGGVMPQPRA